MALMVPQEERDLLLLLQKDQKAYMEMLVYLEYLESQGKMEVME